MTTETVQATGGATEGNVEFAPSDDGSMLDEKSVLISLSLKRPTLVAKVATDPAVTSEAELSKLIVRAEMFESEPYDRIKKLDGQARHYVRAMSLPSFQLPANAYRVPLTLVDEVNTWLETTQAEREAQVAFFVEDFDEDVEAGKKVLKGVAELAKYPTKSEATEKFEMSWKFTALTTPEKLAEFAPEVLKKEINKAGATLLKEVDLIRDALRGGFAELVKHATERLMVREDGKKVIFKTTFVTNMKEFIRTFDAKNLTGDVDLDSLVKQAASIITDLPDDPQVLRDDTELRTKVKAAFDEVKVAVDDLQNVTAAKARKVRLPRKRSSPKTPKAEAKTKGPSEGQEIGPDPEVNAGAVTESTPDDIVEVATDKVPAKLLSDD